LETYLSCEAWCKNSQILMDTENIVYKSKSLHIHRNNTNHILENENGKHTRCFLIHLIKKKLNIKNTQIHDQTPKGQSSFFSKNTSKLPFLAQEAQTNFFNFFFAFLIIRSCAKRGSCVKTTRRTCAKSFEKVDRIDWERKVYFPLCPTRKEAAHFLQKNKFLVITFEWEVQFGLKNKFHVLYSFSHLH
jgi:hypothetical protein